MTRVTDGGILAGTLYGIQTANSRLQDVNVQMATGNQITKPSDDPSNTVRALQLRGDVKRNEQFTKNANDAIGWMSTSDSAYAQIVNVAQKARTLVVQGLNAGSSTTDSNNAIADQIDSLRDSIVALANSSYNGRPVFGGNTTSSAAYVKDPSGVVVFTGDTTIVNRQVGDTTIVPINQSGPAVFGPPSTTSTTGSDIFVTLDNISKALRNSPSTLSASDLSSIDGAVKTISAAQAEEGAAYNRVTTTQTAASKNTLALTSQLSGIQDIDLAAQAVAVSTAQVTYQAALQTTAAIRQTSLLDFLK